jgi:hypothetical protein
MVGKIFQKIIALLIFLLALAGIIEAQTSDRAYRVDNFSTSSSPVVDVATSGGSIEFIGHPESTVQIEMYVRRGSRYLSPSDTDLSDFDITIRKDGDTVIAEAKRRGSWGILRSDRNVSISFKAYVPEAAFAEGKTSGGSVSAERIFNELKLATSGGSVRVKDVEGVVDLRTSGGGINIENASGEINARTSGGSISAVNLFGEAELRTSGGSIRLDDVSAKISARTSGGSIRGSFTTFQDDIELRTSGGSIQVNLPKTEHFELDLRAQRVNTELRNFTGEFERNRVKGRIGNGGPLIAASTSGGSVSVNY